MPRLRFSVLLVAVNAGLVLLAVAGMALAARGLLGRLADEQALARVELAAADAALAVGRSAGDVGASAELLGQRPTVGRLLAAGDSAGLAAFLERYRATIRLTGCAIVSDDSSERVVATDRALLPWADLAHRQDGATLVRRPGRAPLVVAGAPVVTREGARALAVLALDEAFVRRLEAQAGLSVGLVDARAPGADGPGRAALRARGLASPAGASARLEDLAAGATYLAVRPLDPPLAGLAMEAALPRTEIAASLGRVGRRLAFWSMLVAAIAILCGLALGRRVSRPVGELTAAAARIGHGDLETAVPAAPGAELGALAATLDEMRGWLLCQTAELTRRQTEGEAILGGIADGVFSVDRDRRIRFLNPQVAALLGLAPAEAIGRFCGDVLRPLAVGGVRPCEAACPIVHARARGGARSTEMLAVAGGGYRAVVLTSSPPAGELQVQVLRDETDLEAARRMRDAVLAHVSHELKTPLAAQLASIELLDEHLDRAGDEEARTLLAALERGTLRLTQLIDNLLESARIEAGQTSIRRRPVALDEAIEAAVELASPLLVQRGQTLAVELPYPLPSVPGDAPRLTQVFVNLLANANKFAPAGSTIRIGGEVAATSIALWVEDEGPGLPEAPGSSLFGRYVRAPGEEGEGEPEQSGAGLGLWIAQSIVERHGGRIEAARAGEGAGSASRVAIHLPREGA